MPYYGCMVYQAERVRTRAELQEADAQLGQLFAAFRSLARSAHTPRRRLTQSWRSGERSRS
jgi:hypothetical protein